MKAGKMKGKSAESMKRIWPVPESFLKNIPTGSSQGAFWENRGDRFHCGVDIYAPFRSNVVSIESGVVKRVGIATSPKKVPYWNKTKFVLIENRKGFSCFFCELHDTAVSVGEYVKPAQLIGHIGQSLDPQKIDKRAPLYIQELKTRNNLAMLHFELHKAPLEEMEACPIINWPKVILPKNLLNPTNYLLSVLKAE